MPVNEETKIEEKEIDYFADLIQDIDESGMTEEEKAEAEKKRQFNKDAEEKRKRLEAEEKAKKDAEAKAKADADAAAKAAEEAKAKAEKEATEKAEKEKAEKDKEKPGEESTDRKKLGAQLVEFVKKYPDVDLKQLDQDAVFKDYIDGKLLGKRDFTKLYEDYIAVRAKLSGNTDEEVKKNYAKKVEASPGSSVSRGGGTPTDIYSEEDLQKISDRLPYMSRKDAERVMEKVTKSIEFYDKKKK